jgi:hypothetical protein
MGRFIIAQPPPVCLGQLTAPPTVSCFIPAYTPPLPLCGNRYRGEMKRLMKRFRPTVDSFPSPAIVISKINAGEPFPLVTLRFNRVEDLELHDFNAQNVLFELRIEDVSEYEQAGVHFDVVFRSSYGMSAHFVCREIKVVSATPWVPPSAPRP